MKILCCKDTTGATILMEQKYDKSAPLIPQIFYARYNSTGNIDGHRHVLKLINQKKHVMGEKARILKYFQREEVQKFILNSPYFIEVENVEKEFKKKIKDYISTLNFNFKSIA